MKLTGEVHPFAARYPMLPEDQLAEMAADISQNGLKQPIVADAEGRLLDGRNRLEACRRIDFPVTDEHVRVLGPEEDPVRFIISVNNRRRHMSVGQCAMFDVLAEAETANGSPFPRGWISQHSKTPNDKDDDRPTEKFLSWALYVYRTAHEYVDQVLAGASLEQAYDLARAKAGRADDEAKARAALGAKYPDLAAQVEAGTLTLAQAKAAVAAVELEVAQARYIEQMEEDIRLLVESVGPEIDIEALEIPDLEAGEAEPLAEIDAAARSKAAIDRQYQLLRTLQSATKMLEVVASQPAPKDVFFPDGHLASVRKFVGRIVTAAYAVASATNHAAEENLKIRMVK